MTIFKIQYLKEDGTLISTQEYEKASDFLLEVNDLTTVQESENTFRACFVNEDLLSLAGSDDLLVELDANVFKKYPELADGLPEKIKQEQTQLLSFFLDKRKILEYCQLNSKKFFELSGVIGLKDKAKDIYYDGDSNDLPSDSFLYLTQSLDKVYSICSTTKISKVFMLLEDVEYIDVILFSDYGFHPDYTYSLLHKTKIKEVYDNLVKLQG